MSNDLPQELKKVIKGDVLSDEPNLNLYSHDASLFEVKPQVVINPKDAQDVKALVKYVSKNKKNNPLLSLTGRSAGTDMGGGSINDSIIIDFSKYFNHTPKVHDNIATTEPGVFYRDFEKETLKYNLIFPSYPASREICCLGGIVNNNSGGEKSLEYGKTEKYVKKIKVVLSDGNEYEIKPLSKDELNKKMQQKNYYRHSGYPGGLKVERLDKLIVRRPDEVIHHAVWGMMPKTKLGRAMIGRLKIFAGEVK